MRQAVPIAVTVLLILLVLSAAGVSYLALVKMGVVEMPKLTLEPSSWFAVALLSAFVLLLASALVYVWGRSR